MSECGSDLAGCREKLGGLYEKTGEVEKAVWQYEAAVRSYRNSGCLTASAICTGRLSTLRGPQIPNLQYILIYC